jgi:hypothetical protein
VNEHSRSFASLVREFEEKRLLTMRGIIATVFVVLVIAAFATAYPTTSSGKKEVAKKTSSASKKGGDSDAVVEEQAGQGPHLVFREPRNFRFAAPKNEVVNNRRSPYWQQYRSFSPPRGRDDDEDEEEDDTEDSGEEGDEDDVQDEEEEGFETPSWDYLFPPEESNAAGEKKQTKKYQCFINYLILFRIHWSKPGSKVKLSTKKEQQTRQWSPTTKTKLC